MKSLKKILFGIVFFSIILTISSVDKVKADEVKDPKLVLESYQVVGGHLTAGGEGEIKLTIKNESTKVTAYNVLLSYVSDNNRIYPVYGLSNQVYIGTIGAGKKVNVTIKVSVSDILDTDNVLTSFELAGTDGKNNFFNEFFVAVPVNEKLSLKINNVSLAQNSVLGAKSLVSVGYSNDGLEDIYGAVMHIEGKIDQSQKLVNIGNILAGESKYLDYSVTFQQTGNQPVKIYFTYKDKNGNMYTSEESTYLVKVTESSTEDNEGNEQKNDQSKPSNLWIIFLAIGVLLLIGVIISVVIKNRK